MGEGMSDIIEGLRDMSEDVAEEAINEIERLTAEVERLKEFDLEVIQDGNHFTVLINGKERGYSRGHVLTEKQIDAAVEFAEACRVRTPNSTPWKTLNKLGIKRCRCEDIKLRPIGPCSNCNGRGWTHE